MLFTDLSFWYLLSAVILLIIINNKFLNSITFQNVVLLIASYVFYAAWDWKFLGLIVLASLQTYIAGWLIGHDRYSKKVVLAISILINIGILFWFKYYNFFIDTVRETFSLFGGPGEFSNLSIILPVGISFYIFQTLTFVIDSYRKELDYTPSVLDYFTYVAFFPQLVAGPIERAKNLLPQFRRQVILSSDNIFAGFKLIVFGLFLKVIIADNLAPMVNDIFANYKTMDGGTLILGVLYFSAQIYGDFCGYSTIAIGVARLMGFDLMTNFCTPYFSTSVTEFWRRWHISLSTFFRDYLYIPLGGSRGSSFKVVLVTLVTFLVSGFWHGAAWTFIVWGALHGTVIIGERFVKRRWNFANYRVMGSMQVLLGWIFTLVVVGLSWIFFRSESIKDAIDYISIIFSNISIPSRSRTGMIFVLLMIITDWLWRENPKLENKFMKYELVEDICLAIMLIIIIPKLIFISDKNPFIYFQF